MKRFTLCLVIDCFLSHTFKQTGVVFFAWYTAGQAWILFFSFHIQTNTNCFLCLINNWTRVNFIFLFFLFPTHIVGQSISHKTHALHIALAKRPFLTHAFQCYCYLNLYHVFPIYLWKTAVNNRGKIFSLYL